MRMHDFSERRLRVLYHRKAQSAEFHAICSSTLLLLFSVQFRYLPFVFFPESDSIYLHALCVCVIHAGYISSSGLLLVSLCVCVCDSCRSYFFQWIVVGLIVCVCVIHAGHTSSSGLLLVSLCVCV